MIEKKLRQKYVAKAEEFLGAVRGGTYHKLIIDTYNSVLPHPRGYAMTYTAAWCAPFVSSIAVMCDMLPIFAFECSCTKQIEQWKAKGRWIENDAYAPTLGDIIYYDWDDGADYAKTDSHTDVDHVGIVVSCDGKTIKVIEGNKGSPGKVDYRNVAVNGRYIRGFAVPDYASIAEEEIFSDIEGSAHKKRIEHIASLGIMSGYADGTFKPNEPITRGAAASVADRIIEYVDKAIKEGK